MRFLLVNQFVPPDSSPTARLLGDVGAELENRGYEVVYVGNRANYRGGKTLFGSRALREGTALLQLLARGCASRCCDAVICLTSPPLLPLVGRAIHLRHRGSRFIHWAMDLYPDVAVALGEIVQDSRLHRTTRKWMRATYQSCDLIVALDKDMATRIGAAKVAKAIVQPWPGRAQLRRNDSDPRGSSDTPFTWLYSGNLGRAHEWETLLEAQRILEADGVSTELVFQGGGTEWPAARRRVEELGLQRCRFRPYAEEKDLVDSLLAADCLVTTQRPETHGCLWPSKLSLARLLDRPIVWVGATDGAVADLLRSEGHACFAPTEAACLTRHLRSLAEGAREKPALSAEEVAGRIESVRSAGIAGVVDAILDAGNRKAESGNSTWVG